MHLGHRITEDLDLFLYGGFSPMTLAWVIGQLELSRARALGFDGAALAEFRDELLRRLTAEG